MIVQLLNHFFSYNILESFQSAYNENRLTETVLLQVVNDLLSACFPFFCLNALKPHEPDQQQMPA